MLQDLRATPQPETALPIELTSQLVERCTGTAEVKRSNPVQAWIFFRLSFCSCKSCVYNWDDLLSYNSSPRSSYIWFSFLHNFSFIFVKSKNKSFHLPHNLNGLIFIYLLLWRSATLRIRAGQECSKVAFGCPEVASECPEVASELVRDIFEFFDLFFQGKEIIMRKYYYWKK